MQSFAIDLKLYIPEQGANRLKKAKIRFLHCFTLIRKAFNTGKEGKLSAILQTYLTKKLTSFQIQL